MAAIIESPVEEAELTLETRTAYGIELELTDANGATVEMSTEFSSLSLMFWRQAASASGPDAERYEVPSSSISRSDTLPNIVIAVDWSWVSALLQKVGRAGAYELAGTKANGSPAKILRGPFKIKGAWV